jgi:hypothetical protein
MADTRALPGLIRRAADGVAGAFATPPSPVLLSLEGAGLHAESTRFRVRWAHRGPATAPVDLSAPLLLAPEARVLEGDPSPEALTAALLLRPEVRAGTALVLYWETYGVPPRDTVDQIVRITPEHAVGALYRIGMALGALPDRNAPVEVQWRGPVDQGDVRVMTDGADPFIGRIVTLATASLAPGRYRVSVALARDGVVVAEQQQIFHVIRP